MESCSFWSSIQEFTVGTVAESTDAPQISRYSWTFRSPTYFFWQNRSEVEEGNKQLGSLFQGTSGAVTLGDTRPLWHNYGMDMSCPTRMAGIDKNCVSHSDVGVCLQWKLTLNIRHFLFSPNCAIKMLHLSQTFILLALLLKHPNLLWSVALSNNCSVWDLILHRIKYKTLK